MKKTVLVSDFDGTITKKDFFWMAIDELLTPIDAAPWEEYLEKKITHVQALSRIFCKIRMSSEDFHNFVLKILVEDCFIETLQFCRKNAIDFYIVSAGADYYIKLILDHLKISDSITLYSNKSFYTPEGGLQICEPDKTNPFYSNNYGISKKLIIESLKNKYDFVVFAGDGGPDIEAAQISDKVFARDRLLELCNELNINAERFYSYCDILSYLNRITEENK